MRLAAVDRRQQVLAHPQRVVGREIPDEGRQRRLQPVGQLTAHRMRALAQGGPGAAPEQLDDGRLGRVVAGALRRARRSSVRTNRAGAMRSLPPSARRSASPVAPATAGSSGGFSSGVGGAGPAPAGVGAAGPAPAGPAPAGPAPAGPAPAGLGAVGSVAASADPASAAAISMPARLEPGCVAVGDTPLRHHDDDGTSHHRPLHAGGPSAVRCRTCARPARPGLQEPAAAGRRGPHVAGRPGGTTVAVRVRGRPWLPVLVDMVEGVVAANRLTGAPAARAREALWHATAATVAGPAGPQAAGHLSPSDSPPDMPSEASWSSTDRQVV